MNTKNIRASSIHKIMFGTIFLLLLFSCTHDISSAGKDNEVSFTHNKNDNLLIIHSNAIPNHETGEFPNKNNPNTISPQNLSYSIPMNPALHPEKAPTGTSAQGKEAAIAVNGVPLDPFTAEYYDPATGKRTQQKGLYWNFDGLGDTDTGEALGMDFNRAHVQPNGTYHYHGRSSSLDTGTESSHSPVVAFAADGYFVLGQYGLDAAGNLAKMTPSWITLTERTGADAPPVNSTYPMGTFVQDYQHDTSSTTLDKYNGHFGKIPKDIVKDYIGYYDENSYTDNGDGTISMYHYHLTDQFPYIPRAFAGTPHESFSKSAGGMQNMRTGNRPSRRQ